MGLWTGPGLEIGEDRQDSCPPFQQGWRYSRYRYKEKSYEDGDEVLAYYLCLLD
jgi:hypothetical protein